MCTTSSGHIYLMGGRAGNRLLRDVWRFDPGTNLWEEVECRGSSPPSLQEHSMVAWDNKLYIFGGEVGTASSGETPLWILNLSTSTWRRTNSSAQSLGSTKTSPLGRRAHSCVLYADAMHVFGGYQDLLGSSAELWTLDLGKHPLYALNSPVSKRVFSLLSVSKRVLFCLQKSSFLCPKEFFLSPKEFFSPSLPS